MKTFSGVGVRLESQVLWSVLLNRAEGKLRFKSN